MTETGRCTRTHADPAYIDELLARLRIAEERAERAEKALHRAASFIELTRTAGEADERRGVTSYSSRLLPEMSSLLSQLRDDA